MAGNLSDYLEDALLDHFLGTSSLTAPSAVYVALFTVAQDDAGTAGTEVSGGSYVRKAASFDASSGGATANTSDIDFTNMPACTVVGVGVYDHVSNSTNLLIHGTLTSSKTVDAGDTLRISAGDLDISIT